MACAGFHVGQECYLPKEELEQAVSVLRERGYQVIAPVVEGGAVMLRPIDSASQIARGVRDEQDGGRYRLVAGDPELYFQYVVGPESPKRYLFPSEQRLFSIHVEQNAFVMDQPMALPPKMALLGIRPCELAAIRVQDRVFGAGDGQARRCESDDYYNRARREALLIVVNCTEPGGTCFCVSMGTGPAATKDFDLALTELRGGFVVQIGSERGAELAAGMPLREPSSAETELAQLLRRHARQHMGRAMATEGLPQMLQANLEHPRWDQVALRCLGCGNCTMVCPTCFCSTVVDGSELASPQVSRTRYWESCYTHQFSYTTAGPLRSSIRARYRHWLRHKLSTWWEQFGCSGCVGCGRCITWCPVGIDLTEETAAMRAAGAAGAAAPVTGLAGEGEEAMS